MICLYLFHIGFVNFGRNGSFRRNHIDCRRVLVGVSVEVGDQFCHHRLAPLLSWRWWWRRWDLFLLVVAVAVGIRRHLVVVVVQVLTMVAAFPQEGWTRRFKGVYSVKLFHVIIRGFFLFDWFGSCTGGLIHSLSDGFEKFFTREAVELFIELVHSKLFTHSILPFLPPWFFCQVLFSNQWASFVSYIKWWNFQTMIREESVDRLTSFACSYCGPSNSEKTNTLIHMLKELLVFLTKSTSLRRTYTRTSTRLSCESSRKIGDNVGYDALEALGDDILPLKELPVDNQKIVIFDDLVCGKNQNEIINHFINGRHRNCSVIYLT